MDRDACTDLHRFLGIDSVPAAGTIVITDWHHPHRHAFVKWFLYRYVPPKKRVALILPCSHVKPYSRSRIRRQLYSLMSRYNLWSCVQVYTLSDLLGLVPIEVEECYPAANYEFPPTALGALKSVLIGIVAHELRKIREFHGKIIAWLPSKHADIIERAARATGIEIELRKYGQLAFHSMKELVEHLSKVCIQ